MSATFYKRAALVTYLVLLFLILAWEGWLAPAPNAPPGAWIILKCVPLLIPLRNLFRGDKRTYLYTALLLMLYFIDGVILAFIDRNSGLGFDHPLVYANAEWILATFAFSFALLYIRAAKDH